MKILSFLGGVLLGLLLMYLGVYGSEEKGKAQYAAPVTEQVGTLKTIHTPAEIKQTYTSGGKWENENE